MYVKVASIISIALLFTGCSFTSNPKPPKAIEHNSSVQVVEEINVTQENNAVVVEEKPKKIKKNKYNLKPEPFSLESNENDPELLGPQTTIDSGLVKKEESSKDLPKEANTKKEEAL